jgi:hypothetical protein
MTTPQVNVDRFPLHPVNVVAALLPDQESAVASCADLAAAGMEFTNAQLLVGEVGSRIFDFDGSAHGYAARLVRALQKIGSAENVLNLYNDGLRNGEALLTLACDAKIAFGVEVVMPSHTSGTAPWKQ